MAKLKAQNLFCFEEVEIELNPGVTLVSGPNSSGKTRISLILQALISHDPNPLGLSAASKSMYIRRGMDEGQASLDQIIWKPKSGMVVPPGVDPHPAHAVGGVDFLRNVRGVKERAQFWESLFLPDNPAEILSPAWTRPQAQLEQVLKIIERDGWQGAVAIYEDQRREAKRLWQSITGQPRHGPKAGASWVPANWHTDLEGKSEDDLLADVSNAKDALQQLTVVRAIAQEQIDQAKEAQAKIPKLAEKHRGAKRALDDLMEMEGKRSEKLSALDQNITASVREMGDLSLVREREPDAKCPHCEGALGVSGMDVYKWQSPTKEEIDRAQLKIQGLETQKEKFEAQRGELAAELEEVRNNIKEAREIKFKLSNEINLLESRAKDADKDAAEEVSDAQRSVMENALDHAQRALTAWRQYRKAWEAHENICELDEVCHLLGPTGARASLMAERMGKVNQLLARLQEITGWLPIKILDDYSITSDGLDVRIVAANERLKAQWVMQVVCAWLTHTPWIVLDAADLLKGEAWDGLENLAKHLTEKRPELHLILCATSIPKEHVPDYWSMVRLSDDHTVFPANDSA